MPRPFYPVCLSLCVVLCAARGAQADEPTVTAAQAEFFEKQIRPVLAEKCFSCHGPEKQEGGLRLDSRAALLKGSDSGEVVATGKPDESLLIEAIQQTGSVKMPPKEKLSPEAIASVTDWVKQGVPWPAARPAPGTTDAAKSHWAFQPVREYPLPPVKNTAWPKRPLDRFV